MNLPSKKLIIDEGLLLRTEVGVDDGFTLGIKLSLDEGVILGLVEGSLHGIELGLDEWSVLGNNDGFKLSIEPSHFFCTIIEKIFNSTCLSSEFDTKSD